MRVLFITNIPSPYKVDFFEELGKKADVNVLYELSHSSGREMGWEKESTINFNAVIMKSYHKKSESAFCPSVIKYIKKFRNDIIILMGYSSATAILAIEYMIFHKISFYIWADGALIPKSEKRIKYKFKRRLISNATGWFSSGQITNRFFLHYGANENRIYNYVFAAFGEKDILKTLPTEEERTALREKLGIRKKNMLFFAGSFIHRKGIDILIKATKDLQDTVVVLAGGKDLTQYSDLISESNVCEFLPIGFKNKEELKQYYIAADVFVFPTRWDVWGLVVNEAMACGLPVVTTDKCVAGLELVKNGENGFLVGTENVNELRDAVLSILGNKDLRKKMSINCLNVASLYSIENMQRVVYNHFTDIERREK